MVDMGVVLNVLAPIVEASQTLNLSRNFQSFHGELVGAGMYATAGAGAFAGMMYMFRKHLDQLMDQTVPIVIGGGVIGGSLAFATGLTSGASGATLAGMPLPYLSEIASDLGANAAYWTALLGVGVSSWRQWLR